MNWHREHRARMRFGDKMAEWMSRRIGSTLSIFLHTTAFIACLEAAILGDVPADTMLLALTTVVSLEAIYLCLFLQNSSNRHSDLIEYQARADFETTVLEASRIERLAENMQAMVALQESILRLLVEPEIKARKLKVKSKRRPG